MRKGMKSKTDRLNWNECQEITESGKGRNSQKIQIDEELVRLDERREDLKVERERKNRVTYSQLEKVEVKLKNKKNEKGGQTIVI